MTIFIISCAVMIIAALVLIARPLHKTYVTLSLVVTLVPLAAIAIYWSVGHRSWEQDLAVAREQEAARNDLQAGIARLEQRLREVPNDVDTALNLVDALVGQNERSLTGRVSQILETVLVYAPDNPKALWYGAVSAAAAGKFPLARERLQRLLAKQDIPPEARVAIENQIRGIDQQIAATQSPQPAEAAGRALAVQVSLAPELAKEIDKTTPLFVLARDPTAGGPPLAAMRRTVADLPLSVTISDKDAMLPGHGISSVSRVQVVARISKSGTPQAQVGDLFGDVMADVTTAKTVAVAIVINRKVTKK